MREYLHTLYQFTERWVVDDSRFCSEFGAQATPLNEALATTLQWYRDAARRDEPLAATPSPTAPLTRRTGQ